MRERKYQIYSNVEHKILDWEEIKNYPIQEILSHPNCREFTGNLDKNRREIYEWDIVYADGRRYFVKWVVTGFRLCNEYYRRAFTNECEVIGNIHLSRIQKRLLRHCKKQYQYTAEPNDTKTMLMVW